MAKNILVTGGAGFIGSCFVHLLLEKDPDIVIFNLDALTYAGSNLSLEDLKDHPSHHFIHGNICDQKMVSRIFSDQKIDVVVNIAAESHVDRSIEEAWPFVQSNIVGTQVLLDEAKKRGVSKFVQISTDEVYGSLGEEGVFTEQTPIDPSSPYSASKAAADLLCLSYFKTFRFPVIITRSTNNYGPYQFPEKLIPVLVGRALKNELLPLYGDGRNIRTWLHVRDNCEAIQTVMEKGQVGRVYNISGKEERRNIDVAKIILQTLGKSEDLISFVKDRPGHDWRYACEDKPLRQELGWKPKIPFSKGLKETVNWYKDHQDWVKKMLQNNR